MSKTLTIGIGLDSSDCLLPNRAFDDYTHNQQIFYLFEFRVGECTTNRPKEFDYQEFRFDRGAYRSRFRANLLNANVIMMELDTKYETLTCFFDGKDQSIAVDKDLMHLENCMEYVAAISMNAKVSVKLLSFEQRHE